jgi:hypothetical protein
MDSNDNDNNNDDNGGDGKTLNDTGGEDERITTYKRITTNKRMV